jgi:hypothetical protein
VKELLRGLGLIAVGFRPGLVGFAFIYSLIVWGHDWIQTPALWLLIWGAVGTVYGFGEVPDSGTPPTPPGTPANRIKEWGDK